MIGDLNLSRIEQAWLFVSSWVVSVISYGSNSRSECGHDQFP